MTDPGSAPFDVTLPEGFELGEHRPSLEEAAGEAGWTLERVGEVIAVRDVWTENEDHAAWLVASNVGLPLEQVTVWAGRRYVMSDTPTAICAFRRAVPGGGGRMQTARVQPGVQIERNRGQLRAAEIALERRRALGAPGSLGQARAFRLLCPWRRVRIHRVHRRTAGRLLSAIQGPTARTRACPSC
jgi:hypothetical protein